MKKKQKIQKLLMQGNSPYTIHKLIGANVCYVQLIRAKMEAEMWKEKYSHLLEQYSRISEMLEQESD